MMYMCTGLAFYRVELRATRGIFPTFCQGYFAGPYKKKTIHDCGKVHEQIVTEALSMVKFSSLVFRVFEMAMSNKNEKKRKDD